MSKQHFRMTRIDLDEDEGVTAVTAEISEEASELLEAWIDNAPGKGSVTIHWPALRLVLSGSGIVPRRDPAYPAAADIHSSLAAVFYGYLDYER